MGLEIIGTITVQDVPCVVFRIPPPGSGAIDGIADAINSLHEDLGLVKSGYRPIICALCPNYPVAEKACWFPGGSRGCPVDTNEWIIRAEYVPLLQLRGLTVRSSQ